MARQAIFTRAFWKAFWLDLRRARKHRQARKAVGARILLLLFFVAYVGYYVAILHSLHDPATEAVVACLIVLILGIFAAVRYSQWREAQAQLRRDIADAPAEIAQRLQRYAHALTALNERALSELYLSKYALPEGFVVETRRVKIDALRAAGAWEIVPTEVRVWMMRPDGDWPVNISLHLLSGAETLHTLLWALALLPSLRPLDELLQPLNFGKLANALRKPSIGVLPTWELRVARNQADNFFSRCYAEKIFRGTSEAHNEEQKKAIEEWLEAIHEQRQPEAFVGATSVGELDGNKLSDVGRASALRMLTLARVMDLLDGKPAWDELCNMIFQPLLIEHADELVRSGVEGE
jgi:hypothetical protein